jgi:hypothetical protein
LIALSWHLKKLQREERFNSKIRKKKNNACKMMKTDVRFDEYGFEIFSLNRDFRPFTGKKMKKNKKSS